MGSSKFYFIGVVYAAIKFVTRFYGEFDQLFIEKP